MARSDTSGPTRPSSTSTVLPASPNTASSSIITNAARASASSCAMTTPLPAASPSALMATGVPYSATAVIPESTSVTAMDRAVGTPEASMISLANALLPSRRAASADGPSTATPATRSTSARPATSGASGPMITRSMSSPSTRSTMPAWSCMSMGRVSAMVAMPGLPGAAKTVQPVLASARTSACSRPPLPTTSARRATRPLYPSRPRLPGPCSSHSAMDDGYGAPRANHHLQRRCGRASRARDHGSHQGVRRRHTCPRRSLAHGAGGWVPRPARTKRVGQEHPHRHHHRAGARTCRACEGVRARRGERSPPGAHHGGARPAGGASRPLPHSA